MLLVFLVSVFSAFSAVSGCRWAVRIITDEHPDPIDLMEKPLDWMMRDAPHSLRHQATAAPYTPGIEDTTTEQRNHKVNRDGFGVGWFTGPLAFIRKSGEAIVDASGKVHEELGDILENAATRGAGHHHEDSPVVFGHIRAASEGTIKTVNAHPFSFKHPDNERHQFLWMQNGGAPTAQLLEARLNSFFGGRCGQMERLEAVNRVRALQ